MKIMILFAFLLSLLGLGTYFLTSNSSSIKPIQYKFRQTKFGCHFIFEHEENELTEEYLYNVFHTLENSSELESDKEVKKIYLSTISTYEGEIFNVGKSFQLDPLDQYRSHKYVVHIMCNLHILEDKAYPANTAGFFIVKVHYLNYKLQDDRENKDKN